MHKRVEMAINWEEWDQIQSFEYYVAACLWLEYDPDLEDSQKPKKVISAFENYLVEEHAKRVVLNRDFKNPDPDDTLEKVNSPTFDPVRNAGLLDIANNIRLNQWRVRAKTKRDIDKEVASITRTELKVIAQSLNQRPKLLFKDSRPLTLWEQTEHPDVEAQVDIELDTRSYNSWRRMVKILAILSGHSPDNRSTVGKLHRTAQINNIKLGEDTIRKLLKEAFKIDPLGSAKPD